MKKLLLLSFCFSTCFLLAQAQRRTNTPKPQPATQNPNHVVVVNAYTGKADTIDKTTGKSIHAAQQPANTNQPVASNMVSSTENKMGGSASNWSTGNSSVSGNKSNQVIVMVNDRKGMDNKIAMDARPVLMDKNVLYIRRPERKKDTLQMMMASMSKTLKATQAVTVSLDRYVAVNRAVLSKLQFATSSIVTAASVSAINANQQKKIDEQHATSAEIRNQNVNAGDVKMGTSNIVTAAGVKSVSTNQTKPLPQNGSNASEMTARQVGANTGDVKMNESSLVTSTRTVNTRGVVITERPMQTGGATPVTNNTTANTNTAIKPGEKQSAVNTASNTANAEVAENKTAEPEKAFKWDYKNPEPIFIEIPNGEQSTINAGDFPRQYTRKRKHVDALPMTSGKLTEEEEDYEVNIVYPRLKLEIRLDKSEVSNIKDLKFYVTITNNSSKDQSFLFDRPIKPGFALWGASCRINGMNVHNLLEATGKPEYLVTNMASKKFDKFSFTIKAHEWFSRKFSVADIVVLNGQLSPGGDLPSDTYSLQLVFQGNYSNVVTFTVR